ncbi:unnamed protein product [Dicrocoelium dendriticum]|nr:unnamed protein product [Dicrocoelium dendriticum]
MTRYTPVSDFYFVDRLRNGNSSLRLPDRHIYQRMHSTRRLDRVEVLHRTQLGQLNENPSLDCSCHSDILFPWTGLGWSRHVRLVQSVQP